MNLLTLLICLIQMSAVLLAAGVLARALRKRSPDAAAKIGTWGVIASLALLLMAILDAPRPLVTSIAGLNSVSAEPVANSTLRDDNEARLGAAPRQTHESGNAASSSRGSIGLAMDAVLHKLRQGAIDRQEPQASAAGHWRALFVLALGCAVLPLIIGVVTTIRLHHQSETICHDDLEPFQSLLRDLPQSTVIRVCRSVSAPCVTLYGGATIYIPVGWKRWSSVELAAAVLHESMHLRRRDALQRLVVQIAAAMQFFHPLANWLGRDVMLSQEMAADRAAIQRQGAAYTTGLMKLALRLDADTAANDRSPWLTQWFMRPGIVSVSSSHLIRRIEMLTKHSTECLSKRVKLLASFMLVGLSTLCACWTVRADQPPIDSKVATAADGPEQRIAALPRNAEIKPELFTNAPLVPWEDMGPNDTGFFGIRSDQLLDHPAFGVPLSVLVEPQLDTAWKYISRDTATHGRVELGLSTKNIKQMVGTLECDVKNEEPVDEDDANSKFSATSAGGKIWFHAPIAHGHINDSLDRGKIEQIMKSGGVKREDLGDTPFPEFIESILSSMFAADQSTYELLIPAPEKEFDELQFDRLKRGWDAIDGGLVTLCYSLPTTIGYIGDEMDRLSDEVLKQTACVGIGIDFHQSEPAYVRIAFVPRNVSDLHQLEANLEALAQSAHASATAGLVADDEESTSAELRVLESRTITRASSNDGDVEDVVSVTLRVPLESFVQFLF